MANEQNLRYDRSPEELRENGRKGGIRSGETRRRKREMKTAAKLFLDLGVASPAIAEQIEQYGLARNEITNQMAVIVSMFQQALAGDVKAAAFLRDTAGGSPAAESRKEDIKLRREQFEYQKERDLGMLSEVEDLGEVEAEIYGGDTTE